MVDVVYVGLLVVFEFVEVGVVCFGIVDVVGIVVECEVVIVEM